jgi:hypothetical protein
MIVVHDVFPVESRKYLKVPYYLWGIELRFLLWDFSISAQHEPSELLKVEVMACYCLFSIRFQEVRCGVCEEWGWINPQIRHFR